MIERIEQTDPAPIAGSWEKLVNTEKFYNLAINKPLNYDFTGDTVKKGVIIPFGGSNYIAVASTAITGTPSSYVKVDSNGNASYVANLIGVTWNDTYNFWSDGLGNAYLFAEAKAVALGAIGASKTVNSSPTFADVILGTFGAIKTVIETLVGRVNQGVKTTDSPTFVTVNTGHGANELYPMNQGVKTTDSPTFNGRKTGNYTVAEEDAFAKLSFAFSGLNIGDKIIATGLFIRSGAPVNIKFIEKTGASEYTLNGVSFIGASLIETTRVISSPDLGTVSIAW